MDRMNLLMVQCCLGERGGGICFSLEYDNDKVIRDWIRADGMLIAKGKGNNRICYGVLEL